MVFPPHLHQSANPVRWRGHRIVDDRLGFLQDAAQMLRPKKALGVNLVEILRP